MKCLHSIPVVEAPRIMYALDAPRVQFVSCGCRVVGILSSLEQCIGLELVETYVGGRRYYVYVHRRSENRNTPVEIAVAF
jgi:hypothetical protein